MKTSNLHYEFTGETKKYVDIILHRIKATKDLQQHGVKKDDLGGWIEKESNLQDEAWVGDEAMVFGNAQVIENAKVYGNAEVFGYAVIRHNAEVFERAVVNEDSLVSDNAKVYGKARVSHTSQIIENAQIFGETVIHSLTWACENTKIFGNVKIEVNSVFCDNAFIRSLDDFCIFNNFGSENKSIIFFKTENDGIFVKRGCFKGTLEDFVKQVKETHEDNKFAKEYLAMVELVKIKFNL